MYLTVLTNSTTFFFKTLMSILQTRSRCSRLMRHYALSDENCRLAERGYDGLVIGAESHLDVAGRRWYVGDVLAKENGRHKFTLSLSTPHVNNESMWISGRTFEKSVQRSFRI
jgi:hypothetical protein